MQTKSGVLIKKTLSGIRTDPSVNYKELLSKSVGREKVLSAVIFQYL